MNLFRKLGLEWWFTAHFAYGIIQMVFIPILVPTFILSKTGNATYVGFAMGIIGLGGFIAPVLGGLADKFKAHRLVQLLGLVSYGFAAITFFASGSSLELHLLGAAFLGIGSASLLMINPAFVVSAGYSESEQATKLTALNQIAIVGSLAAGVGLASITEAGASFETRFLVMLAICIGAFVVTLLTNKKAADRIEVETPEDDASVKAKTNLMDVMASTFGMSLIAIFFVTIGHGVITGQYPNYMAEVFSIDASMSSLGLSVSAIVSLALLSFVGKAMANKGPEPVWLVAVLIKTAIMVSLSLVAISGKVAGEYLPLLLYIVYLQGVITVDMVQPAIAAKLSKVGAGLTQGLLMFAIAGAYAGGNVISGISADTLGWPSLAWVVAVVTGIAFLIGFGCLIPKKNHPNAIETKVGKAATS
ncbi:MFS transporter [Paraferrimonas sedimenticola]|uniref:Major facilitator superfamily (MFS) profile domain-containing protein n=1 Tax=Paraferrimonas sedimenticola TaxID=375674 RepID=A0AA37RVH1_9GAMM|nr:MFS transporter [Paraferrimonas sedimenticola]GLP96075.1 hypothetical protein GCM10007895_13810 [Paraferrimonas sedimenticola]